MLLTSLLNTKNYVRRILYFATKQLSFSVCVNLGFHFQFVVYIKHFKNIDTLHCSKQTRSFIFDWKQWSEFALDKIAFGFINMASNLFDQFIQILYIYICHST